MVHSMALCGDGCKLRAAGQIDCKRRLGLALKSPRSHSGFALPKGLQTPRASWRGSCAPQDVEIAVVRTHLEVDVVGTIPLVEHFFYEVIVFFQAEADGPLLRLEARVALHAHLHPCPCFRLESGLWLLRLLGWAEGGLSLCGCSGPLKRSTRQDLNTSG